MIPALCGLFLLDAGFIGFRDAAGREGRIFKWQGYYQRAVLRGVTAGLLALGGVGAVAAVALFLGPVNTLETWEQALQPMLAVYSAYTLAVLSALSLWLVPLVEFRTLASVLVLGPFTLIRPLVVLLGALMTMAVSPTHILRPVSASNRIMCMKNTMPASMTQGFPVHNMGQSIQLGGYAIPSV